MVSSMNETNSLNGLHQMISIIQTSILYVGTVTGNTTLSILPDLKSFPAGHWLMPIHGKAGFPEILNPRIRKGKLFNPMCRDPEKPPEDF